TVELLCVLRVQLQDAQEREVSGARVVSLASVEERLELRRVLRLAAERDHFIVGQRSRLPRALQLAHRTRSRLRLEQLRVELRDLPLPMLDGRRCSFPAPAGEGQVSVLRVDLDALRTALTARLRSERVDVEPFAARADLRVRVECTDNRVGFRRQ